MKHLTQCWHIASVNRSLNFYYSSITIVTNLLSHVSPKTGRISFSLIWIYNRKASLNASSDREIITWYSIAFITIPGKFLPAGSSSASWTRSLLPTPQSIPSAIPKDNSIWDEIVFSDYLQLLHSTYLGYNPASKLTKVSDYMPITKVLKLCVLCARWWKAFWGGQF